MPKLKKEIVDSTTFRTFGTEWAIAYQQPTNGFGISPALISLLAQVAAVVIPMLIERCNKNMSDMVVDASNGNVSHTQFLIIQRAIRKEMGFFTYHWYGGRRLTESAIASMAKPSMTEVAHTYDDHYGLAT